MQNASLRLASIVVVGLCALATPPRLFAGDDKPAEAATDQVSFEKQVRPIFQAHCVGCHQPAKAGGGYVITDAGRLRKAGESTMEAIVPGKPEESHLIDQITPGDDGKALMPQNKPALTAAEIEILKRWVTQGAEVDTVENSARKYDLENPPVYTRPPVISAMDFSPDGSLLAVGGFHEVLLWKADGSELVSRLIGLSERVESVKFSPDGSKLAVTGGLPGRMGEIQIWDVAKRALELSVPATFDTVYGASWSPDGSKIAFGCADNSVRAIDAKTGEQLLFMGSHTDWALDTVFSADGSHLMSVGRDMTAKLTEVGTQRFVDNITSITPGALKGGIGALARHPSRDEIVMGGSDGVPKLYRVFRQTVRVIGDDSNLIRVFEPMRGWVTSVAVSNDGKRIAAGSGLDGAGEVHVYGYEFDTSLPEKLKTIMQKVASTRSAEEVAELDKYFKDGVKVVSKLAIPSALVHGVAFRPDGKLLAVGASDGEVRLVDPESGKIEKEFKPVPLSAEGAAVAAENRPIGPRPEETFETDVLPPGTKVISLTVVPERIEVARPFDYVQVLVTGKLDTGDLVDVTRLAKAELPGDLAEFSKSGLVRPKGDGEGTLKLEFGDQKAEIPVKITGQKEANQLDFVHDVAPVLSRLGCNAGTCHGSAQGKNGFKLSLRGYDPLFDVRAFTQELASRRANVASPDDSLMLLKPTGAVPHVGGQLFREGDPSYEILRNWIAAGAKLNTSTPKVAKIELSPSNPIVQRLNTRQQMRVVATYANGEVRDVTRDAYVETGNGEVATANKSGLMTAIRRGEAPILARFEGAYAATTLTVMGDRTGFAWQDPPTYGRIDELVAAKWNRLKIQPSDLCTDAEFIRRVYLDLTGLPPSADEVRAFLADQTETKAKREALVDKLIGSKDYVEYWTNKWADLLQVNRKFLAVEGAVAFRKWIRDQVGSNVPYDKFVHSILTASGSNRENPAASYFKILRDPAATMENTTQLFLAVRFNCNKCHDHPFERWTQDQYYQTAAYFAQVGLKEDPESKGRKIGGTDVESPKPMFEEIRDMPEGEIQHDRTKEVAKPQFPYIVAHETPENAPRRVQLAAWMTSRENPYFARSYVNRLWGYLFGVGIIEPLDDIRAGNPASNPELLEYLTGEFLSSGFNVQHMMRLICKSRTYQLSVADNTFNSDDKTNYSHAVARRLPAEVLFDAVHRVTGAISKIPGLPPGTRAAELPDSEVELPSGFFTTFGRPARESACECERSSGLQLGPVMALVSGPTIGDAIADPENEIKKLTSRETDNGKLVNELFLRILNRPATEAEVAECLKSFAAVDEDHRKLAEELGKREVEVALKRPQEERERQASLAKAQEALAAYEKELAPKLAEAEKQKAQKTAELEAELKKYEGELFAKKLAEWEKTQSTALRWMTLTPKAIESTNGSKAEAHPDGSILVTGENKNGVVTVTAETDLTDITGIRLEVLTDDKLPSKGPGRAPDGNFVLNELEVLAAPKDKPAEAKPVGLHNALSDFNQANLEVTKAADGSKDDPGNGWAVHPAMGVPHWATFEPKEALGASGGTLLTFKFHHKFNNAWTLGRFRLSITKVPKPVGLGLPEEFRTFLATAPELRTEAQKNSLQLYFQKTDTDWQTKANAVALQKAPLPVDPKLKEHKDLVAALSKPLPVDSKLARLRTDLEMSIKQAAANRLTAAQDIAWALVNSPSFLFNH